MILQLIENEVQDIEAFFKIQLLFVAKDKDNHSQEVILNVT